MFYKRSAAFKQPAILCRKRTLKMNNSIPIFTFCWRKIRRIFSSLPINIKSKRKSIMRKLICLWMNQSISVRDLINLILPYIVCRNKFFQRLNPKPIQIFQVTTYFQVYWIRTKSFLKLRTKKIKKRQLTNWSEKHQFSKTIRKA